jgi:hypothetical protein
MILAWLVELLARLSSLGVRVVKQKLRMQNVMKCK